MNNPVLFYNICKYPYLNKVILLNRYLRVSSESWSELEMCYLMNRWNFLFQL